MSIAAPSPHPAAWGQAVKRWAGRLWDNMFPPLPPSRAPQIKSYLGLGLRGFHRLSYVEWGSIHPHTVICVHGYSRNARDFDFLAQGLANCRVVCPDIAGRGESDWLDSASDYHFPQFLADLNALIARLDVAQVDWVGTSMGGLLGLLLAAQPNQPIRRLVLNDVGAFVPFAPLQHIGQHLAGSQAFESVAAVEAALRCSLAEFGDLTDEQWQHLALHSSRPDDDGGYRLHFDPKIAPQVRHLPFFSGLPFWDYWKKVECPVLILRGEHSALLTRQVVTRMLVDNPHATCIDVPNCGHAPALMNEEQIALIRTFFAD